MPHYFSSKLRLFGIGFPLACLVIGLALFFSTSFPSQGVSSEKTKQPLATDLLPGIVRLPNIANRFPPPEAQSSSRLGVWIGGNSGVKTALMSDASVRWARITMNWSTIEPSRGARNYSGYDAQISLLRQNGIRPIVEIRGTPAWASTISEGCGAIDKAGGLDVFESFMRDTVARYSRSEYGVHHWEMWNEPDNRDRAFGALAGVGCWGSDPDAYVSMLERAARAIHSTDSVGQVVLGGLAFDCYPACDASNYFNLGFLDAILQRGAANYFDIANVHAFSSHNQVPRPNSGLVSQFWGNGFDVIGKVKTLRDVMGSRGVTKPVAITELSWTTNNNLELQARYVPKALARGLYSDTYLLTWFSLTEINNSFANGEPYYGLTDSTGQVKRDSYYAYGVAAREFGEYTSVRKINPSEVGASANVEGYAFTVAGRERWVLWARADGQPDGSGTTVNIQLPSNTKVFDKLGATINVSPAGASYVLDDRPISLER